MADPIDPWRTQLEAFGSFVRTQRQLAKLSLRELAELARVSNPYLSQIERGLHEPSIRVIQGIAKALDISTETLPLSLRSYRSFFDRLLALEAER